MSERKTHKQFIIEMRQINSDIEILGEYITNKTKIKCRCKICQHEWSAIGSSLLRNHGCPKCKAIKTGTRSRKTHKQFIREMEIKNPNIEVLEKYVNAKTKIKCRCKIDGHEWSVKPNNLLYHGCPKCGIRNRKIK